MDLVKHLGGSLARTVASTAEIISDRDLRKKAQDLITREAGQRFRDIQSGVQNGAGQLGVRLQQGPRQIQAVLLRLQQRLEEQRLQASLQAERDAPVDVQVGPVLYEDAPQELRSRMWMALLNDPRLTGLLSEERALEKEKGSVHRSPFAGSANDSSSPASEHSAHSKDARSPFSSSTLQSPFSSLADPIPEAGASRAAHYPTHGEAGLGLPRTSGGGEMGGGMGLGPARHSAGAELGRGDPSRSLAGINRNSLRVRLGGEGQELSRKTRAGSLAEMDSSLRSSFRSLAPPSPTAAGLSLRASPRAPGTPRGDEGPGLPPTTPRRGAGGLAPDTPRSVARTASPFVSQHSPACTEPASPNPMNFSPFGAVQLSASPGPGSRLDIDEADRRAEAAEARRREISSELQMPLEELVDQSSSLEGGGSLSQRQGLMRQRSQSLPREAGPGAREVGSTGRPTRGFMTRLRPSMEERRDVLGGVLGALHLDSNNSEKAHTSQEAGDCTWGLKPQLARDSVGDPGWEFGASMSGLGRAADEAEPDPFGWRTTSNQFSAKASKGDDSSEPESFSRRTVSQSPAGMSTSSRTTQYMFTRVKPAVRRKAEGDAPKGASPNPSPLRTRIGELTLPGRGPHPGAGGGRHRRNASLDSLHGDLTPRSVASDLGGDFSSYVPPDGQRFRAARPRSPFKELATHSPHTDQMTPLTPRSVDSDPGHMSPMWAMGALASGGPSLSSLARDSIDVHLDPGLDEWEMVQGASSLYVFSGSRLRPARLLGKRMNTDKNAETLRQRIMEAIWEVQWPISAEYAEGSRYNTLLQISIGQEDVDEVISRDIHRTFPEHPQFGFQQGQQALFRVLKAYSLHDLEVGYCQGMAFVAGVLLMYLPEEPAFKGLCRLMDRREKGGCALRDLYMPGLEGLKRYLRMFEWLMGRLMPQVKEQLEVFAALPVLYASQWFLTAYSCPFPSAFACRVIDFMLTEQRGDMLLRAGLAIMAHIKDQLLRLDDFEDIITYLKVEPLKWSPSRMRQVLNFAASDFVQDDMIRAAQLAIDQGYEGTLSRRGSSLITAAEAAAAAVENQRKLEEAIRQLAEKEAQEADPSSHPTARAARPPRAPRSAGAHQPSPPVGETPAVDAPAPGPARMNSKGKEEMEDEYMAMVMSLDTLWTAQGRA